jgi:ferredoxin
MNIDVMKPDAVNSAECIACMECVTACPTKKGTLKTFLAGKPVKMGIIALIGLGLYIGTLGIGHLTGLVRFIPIPLSQKAIEGGLMVEDIKGSSTWGEVADSFGVELERLYRQAGVDGSKVPPETKLKDTGALIGVKDFEADTVRIALAEILGVPYAGENGKLEPKPAPANANEPANTPEPAAAAEPAATTVNAAPKAPADFALEGTMTIKDTASALGWTPEQVIAKLGLPADIPQDKALRDMKDSHGYTMPVLKTRILE